MRFQCKLNICFKVYLQLDCQLMVSAVQNKLILDTEEITLRLVEYYISLVEDAQLDAIHYISSCHCHQRAGWWWHKSTLNSFTTQSKTAAYNNMS